MLKVHRWAFRLRSRIGHALVRAGRVVGGFDGAIDELDSAPVSKRNRDRRPKLKSVFTVVVSRHAVLRYGERTGRYLDFDAQVREIRNVWRHVEISAEPPSWHLQDREKYPGTVFFGEVADMLFLLKPDESRPNFLIATTVVSNVGARGARRAGEKRARQGRKGGTRKDERRRR